MGKRKTPRPDAPIHLDVEYKRLNAFFADYARNISRGGTFIPTQKPLPLGTEFVFKLGIPCFEEPVHINGTVQWTMPMTGNITPPPDAGDQPGMGIRFVYAKPDERFLFESQIDHLMVKSLGPLIFAELLGRAPHKMR